MASAIETGGPSGNRSNMKTVCNRAVAR